MHLFPFHAHAFREFQDQCIECGMDGFLTKPVRKKDLLEAVEKWVGQGFRLKAED